MRSISFHVYPYLRHTEKTGVYSPFGAANSDYYNQKNQACQIIKKGSI